MQPSAALHVCTVRQVFNAHHASHCVLQRAVHGLFGHSNSISRNRSFYGITVEQP
jgi:hypothetical protein